MPDSEDVQRKLAATKRKFQILKVRPPKFLGALGPDVIERKYLRLKASGLDLGAPLGDRVVKPDGTQRQQVFEHGAIVWARGAGVHEVHGAIWARYRESLDMKAVWPWFPLSDEKPTGTDSAGRFNRFGSRDYYGKLYEHTSIYWTSETGPWAITTSPSYTVDGQRVPTIGEKWSELGGSIGTFGFPIGPSTSAPDPHQGFVFQQFQNGVIGIYSPVAPSSGIPAGWYVSAIHGPIWRRLQALGGAVALGAPYAGVAISADGVGIYAHFADARDGSLLSSLFSHQRVPGPPCVVMGAIRQKWIELGAEMGQLGYPITDELPSATSGERVSHFEGGSIYWSSGGGTRVERLAAPAPDRAGSWSVRAFPLPLHAEKTSDNHQVQDPLAGMFWYRTSYPTIEGEIQSISIGNGSNDIVHFLKPGWTSARALESGATVMVTPDRPLQGAALHEFTGGSAKSLPLCHAWSRRGGDLLYLTITHTVQA